MPNQSTLILPAIGEFDRAAWLAGLVSRVGGQYGKSDVDSWFDARFARRSFSILVAGTDACPTFYFAMTAQLAVLASHGLETTTQALRLIAGYTGVGPFALGQQKNDWINGAADSMVQALLNAGVSLGPHVAFAGHSAGGAILTNLPSRPSWLGNYSYVTPEIDTFGAPRSGTQGESSTADAHSRVERWMNKEDPVPLLPPRSDNWLSGLNGLRPYQILNCSQFTHRGAGYQLNADGTGTPAVLPDVGVPEAVSNLAMWLFAQEGSNTAHSIVTYYNRLLQRAGAPNHTPAPSTPQRVEQIRDTSTQMLNSVARKQASAISAIERTQNQRPVVIPPQFLFRAVRLNRNWFVYYVDNQVAWCGSRRQAHALARHGNGMLRTMQRVAVVNTDALVSAFQTYVAAAVDPSNNFVPTMNTVIPPSQS